MYKLEMKKTFADEDRSKINEVISQFFVDFNPESIVELKDGKCHIVVCFEDPPMNLIKRILECNPDEFLYGNSNASDNVTASETEETVTDSEVSNETEETETVPQVSNETEETETELEVSNETEETETKPEVSDETEETEKELEVSNETEETETKPEVSDETEETETAPEVSNETEETETAPEVSNETEETKTAPEVSNETETKGTETLSETMPRKRGGPIKSCGEIKLISDLATKSSSYEELLNLVTKTIGFGKREEYFIKLVNGVADNEGMSFDKITRDLKMKNSDLSAIRMKITNYFAKVGKGVTLGGLVNEIVKYKDYPYENQNVNSDTCEKKESTEITSVDSSTESKKIDTTDDNQMVRNTDVVKIPELEEFLGAVDKTLPIHERVTAVIEFMNRDVKKHEYEQREISSYVIAGVSLKETTHQDIMKKDKKLSDDARMYTSQFVRTFISLKNPAHKPVLVIDFIEYVKNSILTIEELKSL